MTQYEVITELIIHLKESAAIFWFFRHQTSHLRNRHHTQTSASQIYPYTNSADAIMSHTVKQTILRNKLHRAHRKCVQQVLIVLMVADVLDRKYLLGRLCVGSIGSV